MVEVTVYYYGSHGFESLQPIIYLIEGSLAAGKSGCLFCDTKNLFANRNDTVITPLRPLAPEERVPVDFGHAVTSMAGCPSLGQHVNGARQGHIPRVNTPGMPRSAVADTTVVKTLVGVDEDLVDHLDSAPVHVVRVAKLEMVQYLRVCEAIHDGSLARYGDVHLAADDAADHGGKVDQDAGQPGR